MAGRLYVVVRTGDAGMGFPEGQRPFGGGVGVDIAVRAERGRSMNGDKYFALRQAQCERYSAYFQEKDR